MKAPSFDQQVTFTLTDDLAASHRFYADLLGLEMVLDQGACRIYRSAPNAFIGVCTHRGAPKDPGSAILTLVSSDVDSWARRLEAAGQVLESPPTFNERFNIRHIFVRDPSGYLVEIQQFLDPRWPKPDPAIQHSQ